MRTGRIPDGKFQTFKTPFCLQSAVNLHYMPKSYPHRYLNIRLILYISPAKYTMAIYTALPEELSEVDVIIAGGLSRISPPNN